MLTQHTPFWVWFLPFACSSPWILGIIVLWRYRVRDGFVPPSFASMSLSRR
jgi:hypothetical protein